MRPWSFLAFVLLGCAKAPVTATPEQLYYAVCGTYEVVATNAAELAQTGALSPEAILNLRVWDAQAYDGCKAGAALIAVGRDPSIATALAEKALAAFELELIRLAVPAGTHPLPPDPLAP